MVTETHGSNKRYNNVKGTIRKKVYEVGMKPTGVQKLGDHAEHVPEVVRQWAQGPHSCIYTPDPMTCPEDSSARLSKG